MATILQFPTSSMPDTRHQRKAPAAATSGPADRSPGVYRFHLRVGGRPALYTIDWHGIESELRIVNVDENEDDVIEDLANALWVVRPRGSLAVPAENGRPPLRLV